MNKHITRVWTFVSDSNPKVGYQTLQRAEGSTSCDCKGWCRRVAPDLFLASYFCVLLHEANRKQKGKGSEEITIRWVLSRGLAPRTSGFANGRAELDRTKYSLRVGKPWNKSTC